MKLCMSFMHLDFHAIDIEFLCNYAVTKYRISYKNVLHRKEMKSLALNFNQGMQMKCHTYR